MQIGITEITPGWQTEACFEKAFGYTFIPHRKPAEDWLKVHGLPKRSAFDVVFFQIQTDGIPGNSAGLRWIHQNAGKPAIGKCSILF